MPLKRTTNNNLAGGTIKAGSVSQWTDAQNNVGRQLMMYYLGAGWSKAGAAGVIGNQMQESGLDPSVHGGGLSQWIDSRYTSLQSYASTLGLPVTSVQAQAKFTIHEIQTGYPALDKYLKTITNPSAAALQVSNVYERPAAAAANNSGRSGYANQAYLGFTGASALPPGADPGANSSSGGGGPSSVLDLLTSPVDTLGGWLASVAVNIVKDVAIGIGDVIILPFIHWNQRAVMDYYRVMFGVDSWPMIPWNAAFWGLGYWLLFADPANGTFSMKPGPVRHSRIGSHVKLAQSIPARRELIRPKDVANKTPTKPKPVESATPIMHVRTLRTNRTNPVRITGETNGSRREQRDSDRTPTAGRPRRAAHNAPTVANKGNRTGRNPLSDRSGVTASGAEKDTGDNGSGA